jgi:putative Ca2+/H+ antiporter (TMEM165/GDT1 family)
MRIAVTAGGILHLLPRRAVEAAVAVLFLLGAILLIRESLGEPEHVNPAEQAERQRASFVRIAATSFGVLFAAESGDASQIATAGLAARQGEPVAVALGGAGRGRSRRGTWLSPELRILLRNIG